MRNFAKICSWPIKEKLLLLLLIIFVPASGIIVASGLEHRNHVIQDAKGVALTLAESLAAQQEQVVIGTRQMLSTLAQLPQVRHLNAEGCSEIFHELKDRYPFYSSIGAATPDGNLFANAPPFEAGTVNVSDRKHFKDAIATLDFSSGEYVVGRVSNVPSINYTYPVLSDGGSLSAIVIAGFKLDGYTRFIQKAHLPEGFSVTVLDHKGVRLYRFPESERTPLGEPVPRTTFEHVTARARAEVYETTGGDGVYRIYAFKQLRLREDMPPYMYMVVGIPKEKVLQQASREVLRNLSMLGIIALAALALAWGLGNRLVTEPLSQLVKATRKLAGGEMSTRTGIPHTSDELGRLAESFDEMAHQLEARTTEQRKAEEALREREEWLRSFLENSALIGWLKEEDGRYVFLSENYQRRFGVRFADWVGKTDFELWPKEIAEKLRRSDQAVLASAEPIEAVEHTTDKYGTLTWWLNHKFSFRNFAGKRYVGGLGIDITERKLAEESMRSLPSRLIAAQEEERKRIAHELHDSIGGVLSAIKFELERTISRLRGGMAATPEGLEGLVATTQHAMEEARRIYMDLRPSILDDLGLVATINWFVRQFQSHYPSIRIENYTELAEDEIPESLKLALYRIMQEAFHNVAKHSQATLVDLSLTREDNRILLEVSDNGVGFEQADPSVYRSTGRGLGLQSMGERVGCSGGSLCIRSRKDMGTTVQAEWELEAAMHFEERKSACSSDDRYLKPAI